MKLCWNLTIMVLALCTSMFQWNITVRHSRYIRCQRYRLFIEWIAILLKINGKKKLLSSPRLNVFSWYAVRKATFLMSNSGRWLSSSISSTVRLLWTTCRISNVRVHLILLSAWILVTWVTRNSKSCCLTLWFRSVVWYFLGWKPCYCVIMANMSIGWFKKMARFAICSRAWPLFLPVPLSTSLRILMSMSKTV